MSRTSVCALAAVVSGLLFAPVGMPQSQADGSSPPRFDVASIKRVAPGSPPPSGDATKGFGGAASTEGIPDGTCL
jgi:hypothetical protein